MYSTLVNANKLIEKADEESSSVTKGAGLVLRAYVGQTIADLWGDAPWAEAGKGFELGDAAIFFPKYDNGTAIYASVIADLDAALAAFATGTGELGAGDVLYGGDAGQWEKFANALMARVLNRVSGTSLANDSKLGTALNGSIIASNGDNASLFFDNDLAASVNPVYNQLLSRKDIANSNQMVEMLKTRGEDVDGRLPMYAEAVDTTVAGVGPVVYVGHQNGGADAAGTSGPDTKSDIAFSYQDNPGSPMHLLTYAEIEFIRAEYENRMGNAVPAATAYANGIAASFDQYGVTVPADYATRTGVVIVPGTYDLPQAIAEHKFMALWMQGLEAYNEYRRTGYPMLTIGSQANQATVPTKFPYPADEVSINSDNVKNASLSEMNNTVFWDN